MQNCQKRTQWSFFAKIVLLQINMWWYQGCQIFLGATYQTRTNIPKRGKLYQMDIEYTKWLENTQNRHTI
jgi:hypothetical protein